MSITQYRLLLTQVFGYGSFSSLFSNTTYLILGFSTRAYTNIFKNERKLTADGAKRPEIKNSPALFNCHRIKTLSFCSHLR